MVLTIRKDWDNFNSRISLFVGNEKRVKFWKNGGCGDELLYVSFLSPYALTLSREA